MFVTFININTTFSLTKWFMFVKRQQPSSLTGRTFILKATAICKGAGSHTVRCTERSKLKKQHEELVITQAGQEVSAHTVNIDNMVQPGVLDRKKAELRQSSSSGSWWGRWWTSRERRPSSRPSVPARSSWPAASRAPPWGGGDKTAMMTSQASKHQLLLQEVEGCSQDKTHLHRTERV